MWGTQEPPKQRKNRKKTGFGKFIKIIANRKKTAFSSVQTRYDGAKQQLIFEQTGKYILVLFQTASISDASCLALLQTACPTGVGRMSVCKTAKGFVGTGGLGQGAWSQGGWPGLGQEAWVRGHPQEAKVVGQVWVRSQGGGGARFGSGPTAGQGGGQGGGPGLGQEAKVVGAPTGGTHRRLGSGAKVVGQAWVRRPGAKVGTGGLGQEAWVRGHPLL